MRRFARTLWDALRDHTSLRRDPRQARRSASRRLELEPLELRAVPAALGSLTATAFIDSNGDGRFDAGDIAMSTVPATLTGKTSGGASVNVSMTTNTNGTVTFEQLAAGTYQVSFGPVVGFAGSGVISNIQVGAGQDVSVSLGFEGMLLSFVSQNQFLSDSAAAPFRFIGPFVKTPIGNVSLTAGGTQTINLAANFSATDITTSVVRADTNQGSLSIRLTDSQTPQTVANFYDYINSGRYDNSIVSRLVGGFVLQGGGATFHSSSSGGSLTEIPTFPTVANEFGASNVTDTIAMAQSGGDINSATDQFFFNLANNVKGATAPAIDLNTQKFTVFGQLLGPNDQALLTTLAGTATQNMSTSPAGTSLKTVDLLNVPLFNYNGGAANFPKQTTASNYILIKDVAVVSRPEFLTYSVVSNSAPQVVSATVTNERLTLTGLSAGTATITVRATDVLGNTVDTAFTVNVI
jgi:peptidyl-prolyl cis-trans isomerase A (cyclophilin A)